MFDTRSGFWLMASIVIINVLATAAVVTFAPDEELTYENFAAAIGAPMTVILPMIGILAVTSEWSQRSGLTTFTLVPHRGRVLWAKFLCAVGVGIVAMFVALVVGALGNVVGTAIAGTDPVWNVTVSEFALIVLGQRPRAWCSGSCSACSSATRRARSSPTSSTPSCCRRSLGLLADEPAVVRRPPAVGRLQLRAVPALRRLREQRAVGAPRRLGHDLTLLLPLAVGLVLVRRVRGQVSRR